MFEKVQFWQFPLLTLLKNFGARVSHRNPHMKYDERKVILFLDKVHDNQSGLSVGDKVRVNPLLVYPWASNEREWRDAQIIERREIYPPDKSFWVLAFFRVEGRIGRSVLEGTFCALAEAMASGEKIHDICRGQELREPRNKINLYWVGCLEKDDPSL